MQRTPTGKLDASALGDLCLAHLAENPEELGNFMGLVGYDPASLRSAVGSPQLAQGLIDYFASNESLMMSLCANAGIPPESFMRVWHQINPAG